MTGLVVTWGGDDSSDVPELICIKTDRNLFGKVRDEAVEMAGSVDGDWVFSNTRGNRPIMCQMVVVDAPATRRFSVGDAAIWLDKQGYQTLFFSDQTDRYWEAFLRQAPPVSEWKQRGDFTIEWSAKPYAFSIDVSEQCITATPSPDSGTFNVPSEVDGICPVIEITPLDGPITGYTLGMNDFELVVESPVSQGATQTISSCSYTITGGQNAEAELNGAYSPDPLWSVDASGEFPLLVAGTNSWALAWTGSATIVRICIYWRGRFY
jgi:phage-related protein